MITCEEATRLISESLDRKLPLGRRIGLRIHLLMCKLCPRFLRQMLLLRNAAYQYREEKEKEALSPSDRLSLGAKEKIKQALKTHSVSKSSP